VTGSYEDHPKLSCGSGDLCGSEQLDERHQICSNAEREPTGEFLGQKCSAGEPETVCTVVDVPNHKGPEVYLLADGFKLIVYYSILELVY